MARSVTEPARRPPPSRSLRRRECGPLPVRLLPTLRKATLAAHLALSVGWLGAVAAYLALDLTAATGADPQVLRAAYLGMGAIAGLRRFPREAPSCESRRWMPKER